MVASQLSKLTENTLTKPFHKNLLLPQGPPDVLPLDHVDLDFSDVFGPLPTQASQNLSFENSNNMLADCDANELVYDNPAVIFSRSHSLVGPTNYVNQTTKLSKLTLCESDSESLELVEGIIGEAQEILEEAYLENAVLRKSDVEGDARSLKAVGLEDFEILKVVGQGAFAKVYQVRKIGSSEIFAMKVMRKDKIVEKNHAEYMKAERDILTKIDHPFIVQLRYSFQVIQGFVIHFLLSFSICYK